MLLPTRKTAEELAKLFDDIRQKQIDSIAAWELAQCEAASN